MVSRMSDYRVDVRLLGFRTTGLTDYRHVAALRCQTDWMMGYWDVRLLRYRKLGCRIMRMSDYWDIANWDIGLLGCRTLECRNARIS